MKVKQYKLARRLGARIFPKTENPKLVLGGTLRKTKKRPRPLSEFGMQLLEKQKTRYFYGLREKQFSNYVRKAIAEKNANPMEFLYSLLEKRLDNVVFRLGIAPSRAMARQLVSHGHIMVNGRKVSIASRLLKKDDVVSVRPQSKEKTVFQNLSERLKEHTPLPWLSMNEKELKGVVRGEPALAEGEDTLFNLTSVIEFYSR